MGTELELRMTDPLTLERRDDGIAVIHVNSPGQSQNTLDRAVLEQAPGLLDELERDRSLAGVILLSDKPGSFIAGADIHMIEACRDADEVAELSRAGQRICDRIAGLRVPVVAAIDGVCLGGGLELALACDARIATAEAQTRLGLPEVQLGLLPGSGGTQRLPRLVGITAALDLMLTGRQIDARRARALGLVDDTVARPILLDAALRRVREGGRREAAGRRRSWLQRAGRWLTDGNTAGRNLVFSQTRKRVERRSHGNYPAPVRIVDCVEKGFAEGFRRGLEHEARAFGDLAVTPQARQLMGIYFATTAMKKETGVDGADVEARPVHRAAVLGAGLMGAGIAFVTVDKASVPVRLKDVKAEGLGKGLAYLHERIDARRKRRSLTAFEADREKRRVTATLDFSGFRGVDLVIEAVFEDLALKHRMVADIERECPPDTIFASNTSSIPIARIAEAADRPQNVVGMHYFSPVEKMPLLEVIAHDGTAPDVVATAVAVGRRQGKTPIVVRDGAGFYVNRILAPYLNEAVYLLEEGVAIDRIDRALVKFGFPVGPFKLLDEVGIDISAHVAPILHDAFGERMRPLALTWAMIDAGRLGRKSGRGFYRYGGRKSGKVVDESVYGLLGVTPSNELATTRIVERAVLPMLNEAVRCLDEGILRSARDGDIGAVFGIGFPPFRGGPFRYLDSEGPARVLERLQALARERGPRFEPAPGLETRVREHRGFHAEPAG
jgi:3-hydroxyacyl-CoA dehydrogenase/enoyl-CoA hydratase/3-hydroxybutyryl-CoA epimerase